MNVIQVKKADLAESAVWGRSKVYLLYRYITDHPEHDDGEVGLEGGHPHRQGEDEGEGGEGGGGGLPVVEEGVAEEG